MVILIFHRRRCLENQTLACMLMRARQWVALFLAVTLLAIIPPVSADNDISNATPLTNGVSTNGYVCYDDGCSPNDQTDWWKIYAYKGDIVQVGFSGRVPAQNAYPRPPSSEHRPRPPIAD